MGRADRSSRAPPSGQPQSLIQGNVIGLDASQTFAIGNGQGGIFVNNVTTQPIGQTIGGSTAGAGNIITGNANVGIQLFGPQAAGSGVNDVVQGNLIGLNAGRSGRQHRRRGLRETEPASWSATRPTT